MRKMVQAREKVIYFGGKNMAIKRLNAKGTRGESLPFHAKLIRIVRFPYLESVSPKSSITEDTED